MESLSEFFYMGGHGRYIWSAYAITTVVLVANLVFTRQQHRQARLQATRQQKAKLQHAQSTSSPLQTNAEVNESARHRA